MQLVDVGSPRERLRELRPLVFEDELHAHRFRDDEDVAEEDGRVDAEYVDRLQRHFGGEIGRLAELEETDFLADGTVLRQVAPGLPHQPDRRLVDRSPETGLDEPVGHRAPLPRVRAT